MKQFICFIKKEIYHIIRDPLTLSIMLILPVVLVLILGFAITTEIRNTPFVALDQCRTIESQKLIEKIDGNAYFTLVDAVFSPSEVKQAFRKGKCKLAVVIPPDFANGLLYRERVDIQVLIDASDPNEGSNLYNYLQLIVAQYQKELAQYPHAGGAINTEIKLLYNPQMKGTYSIVPGLIGMIMLLICTSMTSISIAREKELGTMEILLVSPLKPVLIVLAKAVPYLVISLIDMVSCLLLSHYVLAVPIRGNIGLILLLSFIYTLSAVALGLLISAVAKTQQEAMVTAGVGLLLPSILLSNLIFPIDSMPVLLQLLSYIVPARWFIDPLRDIMIKGVGLSAIWVEFLILGSMSAILLFVSIKKFKNRL
ncbi:MAG TPA: multidrug ABC transporter permease [Porphyromonadaceae bacterium]|nr:multidrug ABC transporter permease [Porphyromonadaceae bacterium]